MKKSSRLLKTSKKLIKTILFKTLLFSSFFINESNNIKINRSHSNLIHFYLKKQIKYSILDPLNVVKTVKQFIRYITFFGNISKPLLYLSFESIYNLRVFLKILKNKKLSTKSFFLYNSIQHQSKKDVMNYNSFGLINFGKKEKKALLQKNLMNNRIYLTSIINTFYNFDNFGYYKINNNLHDWKSLLFIIILLKNLYIKKKKLNAK